MGVWSGDEFRPRFFKRNGVLFIELTSTRLEKEGVVILELINLWKEDTKMFNKKSILGFSLIVFVLLSGCMSATQHKQNLPSTQEREMTLGIVQKEIHIGMSQADVATTLGSPNIVTRDSSGKETWIYDKIATEASYSKSQGYGTILVLGFSRDTGAISTTQKTLTVVIKFDEKNLVESFSYHASKF